MNVVSLFQMTENDKIKKQIRRIETERSDR